MVLTLLGLAAFADCAESTPMEVWVRENCEDKIYPKGLRRSSCRDRGRVQGRKQANGEDKSGAC